MYGGIIPTQITFSCADNLQQPIMYSSEGPLTLCTMGNFEDDFPQNCAMSPCNIYPKGRTGGVGSRASLRRSIR